MNNSAAILRALITYGICIPLAIFVGSLAVSLANSPTYANFSVVGILALILSAPILLRWHHPLLVLSWNLPLTIFFVRGSPNLYLPMMAASLGISVLQRTMNKDMRFIRAPQITLPLLLLAAVVLVTAKLTGGIGLNALGSSVMGGKKYVLLFAGILGFFALTARRIPPQKAGLYVAMFFLGACLGAMGDLIAFIPSSFYFIFLIFPPDIYAYSPMQGNLRFSGVCWASAAVVAYMLARYGINGIFRAGKPWRLMLFIAFNALSLLGGFRSAILGSALLCLILFFLEGLHRTKLLPILAFSGLLAAAVCLPLANRLPYSVQRVLSVLPPSMANIDPGARGSADDSLNWRLNMWRALLPQVPEYLLLGKGYALSKEDLQLMGSDTAFHSIDPGEQSLAISGDYHSGPLSVILPFGIWGVIAFVWFLIAGVWALRRNSLYGDASLQTVNRFLFTAFLVKIISFVFIFGSLSVDMAAFAGLLGLSISLNGGICRPARNPAATTADLPARLPAQSRWRPAFQR